MKAKVATDVKIVYIGSSARGLIELTKHCGFKVLDALCLSKRITNDLRNIASQNNIPLTSFDWIPDFRKLILRYADGFPFLIYQLDMLVPADLTDRYRFFNLHRGNLFTNRGPNPEIWTILNGDKETSLSLHRINDKIDSGVLIDAYDVDVRPDDDIATIKAKMEQGLPMLISSLHEYLKQKRQGVKLVGGKYYPWVTESDFTIDIENDPIEIMERKIRSQRQYNGAIIYINSEKKYVVKIEDVQKPSNLDEEYQIIGDKLKVKCQDNIICFKMNLNPQYPPPPKFPPSKRI